MFSQSGGIQGACSYHGGWLTKAGYAPWGLQGRAHGTSNFSEVDQRAREVERKLEPPLLALALLTIPAIALEYSDAGEPWEAIGVGLNWAIWLAFVAEVVIMLRVVPNRGRWLREHPLDVAIVVFTPPFLPASLQAARAFRLLRLLKAGVLARRMFSTEGVHDAAVLTLLAVLGGGAFAAVEKEDHLSAWDGVWWAITTVTTVGYGDPAVTTDGGRIIAIFLMVTGIGFVAVMTGTAAERFVRNRGAEEQARERTTSHRGTTPRTTTRHRRSPRSDHRPPRFVRAARPDLVGRIWRTAWHRGCQARESALPIAPGTTREDHRFRSKPSREPRGPPPPGFTPRPQLPRRLH